MSSISAVNAYVARVPRASARTVTYAGATAWGFGFAIVSAIHYSEFGDRRYDLGNFTQAIWNTAHGHFLEVTEVGGAQVSRLGIHVDPIIALFAPLWWLWPSPMVLVAAQALALAFGAAPLFWLARKHLRTERDAAFIALAYLLCPAVGWNVVSEFHAVALAVPLLLLATWFLDEDRLALFAVSAAASVLCQEQIGLIVVFLGLWYGGRRPKVAVVIAASGLAATAIDFAVILRHYSGGSPYSGRYAAVGGSFGGIARNVFVHPDKILNALQLSDIVGAAVLLIPVLGLCLRSPVIIAALPQAVLLTLSGNQNDWRYTAQNVLVIVPFVYVGSVLALARRDRGSKQRRMIGAEQVFAFSAVIALLFGPSPLWLPKHRKAHVDAQRHGAQVIPRGARVSATNHLGSQLASRRYTYVFPAIGKADWIALDTADAFLPSASFLRNRKGITVQSHDLAWQPIRLARAVRSLEHDPDWRQVYSDSTIHVFERRSPAAPKD